MLAGFAVKEAIVGGEPALEEELELLQLPRITQENEMKASRQEPTTR